ncbi:MAG: MacB family efflux pump subunit [Parvibaculum sp.]|uniref:MacB family efflux pump subunit n=1 Tax=Parvibaculum sp. TaxID=2024848 RepID=UPI0025D71518|nr:MacB family efflux pump subunit [Parvibaculum sp.]MCE9650404.1 MacB family efflux pump subunit [Parvibaculum sp.]
MSETPLIEIRNVCKTYVTGEAEVRALDDVSLTIHAGEFVAIMGQSGSGKSTLMNILGCLDRPTSGHYLVDGVDVANLSSDELAALRRDGFGFVFQRYNLLPTMTATENVELPAIYAGKPHTQRLERAKMLIARLGLGGRGEHKPTQLSGGQQQRVSIARALMNDAPIILADEPTGALDSQSGAEVLALLAQLNAEGRTVLLITHDASVAEHARRLIRLADGRVLDDVENAPSPPAPAREAAAAADPVSFFRGDLGEAVKMAFRSLRMNIFRTALTLLGVVIGVGAVVAMLAIGNGSKANVLERISAMGTNLLMIRPGAPGIRSSGDIATLKPDDATAISALANVDAAVPERSTSVTVRYGNIDYRTQVTGTWPAYPVVRDWNVSNGGFFTKADVDGYAPVIVIGQTIAGNLFPDGDNPVGKYILVQNVPFEVVGIMEAKGSSSFGGDQDDVAFVPLSTGYMRLFGKQYVSTVSVKVTNSDSIDETQDKITSLLTTRHRTQDFQVRNTASILETATETQNTLTILLGSVAAISLIVGGIGVMNIMLVSVTERTREIGIRMATGARQTDIMLQFNTEALVVCGVGGLIGVIGGLGTAAVCGAFGLPIAYSATPPLFAFSCAFLTGLLFGYLPARKAASLDPVVALASE